MPRLSVLVPACNAADTIVRAVRSTLRDMPRDAEIVVLDDGSRDGTADVVRTVSDPRVRVISRPNRGVAVTLNDLLEATDSEFVARMDADDVVLPGRFGRELRAVDSAVDAVFTTVVTWGTGLPRPPRPSSISAEDFGLHLLLTNPVAHPTLLARRTAVDEAGGYRDVPSEDYDLWLRLALHGARIGRLGVPGLAYREHPGQVTASEDWRRASWQSEEIARSYSALAEQLIGVPATRITALAFDPSLDLEARLLRFDRFAAAFERALPSHSRRAQRALRRKLAERRQWLSRRSASQGAG